MSVTPPRLELVRLLALYDQQIADTSALIAELPEDSPDAEAAGNWLAESRHESDRVAKLLATMGDEKFPLAGASCN